MGSVSVSNRSTCRCWTDRELLVWSQLNGLVQSSSQHSPSSSFASKCTATVGTRPAIPLSFIQLDTSYRFNSSVRWLVSWFIEPRWNLSRARATFLLLHNVFFFHFLIFVHCQVSHALKKFAFKQQQRLGSNYVKQTHSLYKCGRLNSMSMNGLFLFMPLQHRAINFHNSLSSLVQLLNKYMVY